MGFDHPDPLVVKTANDAERAVGGAVVHDDQFEVTVGLCKRAPDGLGNICLGIVGTEEMLTLLMAISFLFFRIQVVAETEGGEVVHVLAPGGYLLVGRLGGGEVV